MGTDLKKTSKFQYMFLDTVIADIEWGKDAARVFNYTDDILLRPFGVKEEITPWDVDELFKERCLPETRANLKQVLKDTWFGFYDPYLIVRETNGVLMEDKFWIRFDDRMDLTWEDVSKIIK